MAARLEEGCYENNIFTHFLVREGLSTDDVGEAKRTVFQKIEAFVETYLCKLYVILRSRVLLGGYRHWGYKSGVNFALDVQVVAVLVAVVVAVVVAAVIALV